MDTILRNIKTLFRRYKMPSILNIIGLSIAFASFIIIMIQVIYDLGYDKHFKKSDRIYRVEVQWTAGSYSPNISCPLGNFIIENIPQVEAGCHTNWSNNVAFFTPETSEEEAIVSNITSIDSAMITMFDFETVSGDLSKADHIQNLIISEKTALKYFKTANAAGKTLLTTDKQYNVVGVFRDFPENTFIKSSQIFALNDPNDSMKNNFSEWSFQYYLLLSPGSDPKEVTADIIKYMKEKKFRDSDEYADDLLRLSLLPDIHFNTDMPYDGFEKASFTTTLTLLAIAILILIIASINFVNFATSLVPMRIRNINTQKVLGSTVGVLRTALLCEAMVLSALSFLMALLIVYVVGSTSFPSLISASIAPSNNVGLISVLAVVALLTGLIAGLYPAYYTTSFAPALILKGSFGLSPRGRKMRSTLIAFQFVISLVLITVSIFIRVQNDFMKGHDVGFNRENILNVRVPNSVAKQPSAFRDKLMQNPSIKGLTFADGQIISDGKMGWGRKFKQENINFDCLPVSTEFLDVMGMKIVDGRNFIASDSLRTDGAFIFNENAARKFGIKVGDKMNGHNGDAEVVGIVADFNFQPMQYAISPICLYVMGSKPWRYQSLAFIRVSGDVKQAKEYIEKCLRDVAPDMKEINVIFMDDSVGRLYAKEDNLAKLITIFSLLAIAISIIGVFGMVMFDTRYRRKEIALRKVHGSSSGQIVGMFSRAYVYMVLAAFVVSAPLSYYIMYSWLENFAYRSAIHWWIFAVSLGVVMIITIITTVVESFKSASENPVKSIKSE